MQSKIIITHTNIFPSHLLRVLGRKLFLHYHGNTKRLLSNQCSFHRNRSRKTKRIKARKSKYYNIIQYQFFITYIILSKQQANYVLSFYHIFTIFGYLLYIWLHIEHIYVLSGNKDCFVYVHLLHIISNNTSNLALHDIL